MRLAIIIPTIGRGTLKRAEKSVQDQTVRTECIVYKDIFREGAGPTRNHALRLVKTPWVGFCDDDDWLDPHYHEWLDKFYKGYDAVIFQMKNQPNGGIPYTTDVEELKFNEVGMSFALRTDLALKYLFNNMIGEDYDLLMRLKQAGHKLRIVPKIAYYLKDY